MTVIKDKKGNMINVELVINDPSDTLGHKLIAEYIAEQQVKVDKLMSCMADISNMCIGDLAMNYRLDAQEIGQMIYEATGLTQPELCMWQDGACRKIQLSGMYGKIKS